MLLGCIADDFTGGTDAAAALRRSGMSVTLLFGPPTTATPMIDTDAVVVALKTRTIAPNDAVAQSLEVLEWLLRHEVGHVYFKYCSTFDSTDRGNIGPVADALLSRLGEPQTLICPASPEHGRTVYQGHLFVWGDLLSESPMRHHPLTPMTESRLATILAPQTDGSIDTLNLSTVRAGLRPVTARLSDLANAGVRHLVVDAVNDNDLATLAAATDSMRLLTGGAGLAGALGRHLIASAPSAIHSRLTIPSGPPLILAGSCSAATLRQVDAAKLAFKHHRLDPAETPDPSVLLEQATEWLTASWGSGEPLLIYSSAGPEDRSRAMAAMGPDTAEVLERTLGELARTGVGLGATRIVIAGGETSGAVVQALEIGSVVVADEEDRGVPWCLVSGERPLALLLKSGNFGTDDLLVRASTHTAVKSA